MGAKRKPTYDEHRAEYRRYMKAIRKTCDELGLVAYLPDYHADGDPNTVLIYTKENEEYNRKLEAEWIPPGCPRSEDYAPYLLCIQNTDVNGRYSPCFANNGRIDLRGLDDEKRLSGAIRLAFYSKQQEGYIRASGGVLALRECDDTYNDLNRKQIEALRDMNGRVFLGSINWYGEDRKAMVDGLKPVLTEWTGEKIYNFACDYAVPEKDLDLALLIREWNGEVDQQTPGLLDKIFERVKKLGGINMIWY